VQLKLDLGTVAQKLRINHCDQRVKHALRRFACLGVECRQWLGPLGGSFLQHLRLFLVGRRC
jgi:hypothetical protein